MTNENDRKDENQPQNGADRIIEAWFWALALFVSTMIPAVVTGLQGGGPIWTVAIIIIVGIPAAGIGFVLGLIFGAPRLTNSAKRFKRGRIILTILCLGFLSFLFGWISMNV